MSCILCYIEWVYPENAEREKINMTEKEAYHRADSARDTIAMDYDKLLEEAEAEREQDGAVSIGVEDRLIQAVRELLKDLRKYEQDAVER